MLDLRRSCLAAVEFERGLHVLSNVFEAGRGTLPPSRVRLQKIVPDVSTGNVNIGPDVV